MPNTAALAELDASICSAILKMIADHPDEALAAQARSLVWSDANGLNTILEASPGAGRDGLRQAGFGATAKTINGERIELIAWANHNGDLAEFEVVYLADGESVADVDWTTVEVDRSGRLNFP